MITHRQLFMERVAQTSETPLMLDIVTAHGSSLFDASGKEYTDLISGIAVSNIGHCHPAVTSAIKEQLENYMHLMVYGEYVQSPQVRLAKALVDLLPAPLDNVYFVNSGAEAIEGSLKLAKRYTGRSRVIAFKNAYHGSTHGALSLMSDEYFKNAFRPLLPGISFINFNNLNDLQQIDEQTACVFVEMIQGEAGAVPADPFFMAALRSRCNETGTLLVADEIQTGYGRTGSFFAFSSYDIVPDILVLAKGMGGGMPLGAFISSKEIMSSLKMNPALGHITTFGGHPVCCAASLATLEVISQMNLEQTVAVREGLIRKKLKHHAIREISGKGLMLAVEFENAAINREVISKCIQNGVVTDWFLFAPEKMRIAPPLVISEKQLSQALDVLLACIAETVN